MRKLALFLAVCALTMTQAALAEDINPPPWGGQPNTTVQGWEFLNADPSPPPDLLNNEYGDPYIEVIPLAGAGWFEQKGEAPYIGWWPLSGEIWVEVPNDPTQRPWKEIWIQITWSPQDPGEFPIIEVEAPDPTGMMIPYGPFDEPIAEELLYFDPSGADPTEVWHSTYDIWIPDNPEIEIIHIFGTIDIDELIIDTRCVPEPGTLALAGIGLLSLLGLRRRK